MYLVGKRDNEEKTDMDRELLAVLPAIRSIAAKVSLRYGYRATGMVEDLTQTGAVGFVKAYRRYQAVGKRTRSEYALSGARYAIFEGLRRSNPNKRAARAKAREINWLAERLTMLFGRRPTSVELASALGVQIDCYHRMIAGAAAGGLADPIFIRVGAGKAEEPISDLGDSYLSGEGLDRLRTALSRLPDKEREVVELAFLSSMRLEDIGAKLGYQKGYISKLRKRGLGRLAELIKGEGEAFKAERRNRISSGHYCRPSLERAQPSRTLPADPGH